MNNRWKNKKKKGTRTRVPEISNSRRWRQRGDGCTIFVNLFFPSIWRADYARNAFEIAFTPSPVTFDRKPLCVAVRFAVGPGKSRPRFRGTPANRVVVYREISTLTSFRRPRNSFRRSPSAVHWRGARRNLAYRGKNHFLSFFFFSPPSPSLFHRLLPFLSPSPYSQSSSLLESASFRDDDRFILADDRRIWISAGKKVFESRSRHVELIVVRAGINRFRLLSDDQGGPLVS